MKKKAAQPSYLIGILKGMFPELVVTETEDVEQLLDISSRQSALDYLLSNEVDDRWCEIAAAVMLYDASVSDAGDGNEVDDKEFTQKIPMERLIMQSLSIIQRIRLAEMWQEAYTADTWRAVSRALSSLPDVHMRIF